MSTHIVEAHEHLAGIAAQHGFENLETILNAPENGQLREKRGDPNQLLAGDEVFIPEKRVASFERPVPGHHSFRVHIAQLELRLKVLDLFGKPVINAACTLKVDGESTALKTDSEGLVIAKIKRTAALAELAVADDVYHLQVGALDPLPEQTGVEGRLQNLGYLDAEPEGIDGEQQVASAVELFQADQGLAANGEVDDQVLATLEREHGC